ncbi:MAG: RpiB/LacA/LacB family sugar-phosphate isomerase [Kiritimatiellia bacterium]|jgi:ribose 5-phosphate isomerase RpiB|nr:RpiB/LacA/LacB family sugar-phosphate isomerase [Kiritimatiellia bacterium]
MKIAVISEISTADRNKDIIRAMEGREGHEIINFGMKGKDDVPEMNYNETAFLGALLLNTKRVDFVIGGCSTGQGFMNSILQYPGISCGHIMTPLDAWLFTQINGGNAISLTLNLGYGWGSDENLFTIFDKLLCVESCAGYPAHRKDAQRIGREQFENISRATHVSFAEVLKRLPEEFVGKALAVPGVYEILETETMDDEDVAGILSTLQKS